MKKRIIQITVLVLLCTLAMQFFAGCGRRSRADEIIQAKNQKIEELMKSGMTEDEAHEWVDEHEDQWHPYKMKDQTEQPTKDPIDFMETICGTYLVSGTGHLTGNGWYDEDLTTQDTTFTNLALHVSQVGDNSVQIDLDGEYAGSGTVSAESPTVTYTGVTEYGDSYQVTVTFTVKDGVARVDFSFHSSDSDSTTDVKLSGEK